MNRILKSILFVCIMFVIPSCSGLDKSELPGHLPSDNASVNSTENHIKSFETVADDSFEPMPALNLDRLYPVFYITEHQLEFVPESGYIDKHGNWAFPDTEYVIRCSNEEYLDIVTSDLLLAELNGFLGYINYQGVWVIDAQYEVARPFHEGIAYVNKDNGRISYFIDELGTAVIDCSNFEAIGEQFHEGLNWAIAKNGGDHALGYINREGRWVVEPQFPSSHMDILDRYEMMTMASYWDFSEGMAIIKQEDQYGYIDRHGQWVISPEYENALPFSEGLGGVYVDGKWGFIDASGTMQIDPQIQYVFWFSEGLAAAFDGRCWGFIDPGGQWVIEPKFAPVSGEVIEYIRWNRMHITKPCVFYDGLSIVRDVREIDDVNGIDYPYGYINREGEWVIPPRFSSAYPFNGELAFVGEDITLQNRYGTRGYINRNGEWVINWVEQ